MQDFGLFFLCQAEILLVCLPEVLLGFTLFLYVFIYTVVSFLFLTVGFGWLVGWLAKTMFDVFKFKYRRAACLRG